MIALIIAKKNKPASAISKNSMIESSSSDQPKKPLVAKWLLDENSSLYCQWIKEDSNC